MKEYKKVIDKYSCCGCRACEQVCPCNAIIMTEDSEGFLFPLANENLCNDCGLCKTVCQYEKTSFHLINKQQPLIYALRNVDLNKRISSSSGGIFIELATEIINLGGYVVGVEYGMNNEVVHTITNDINYIEKFKTSKYVKSELNDIYSKVKNLLSDNNHVLFTGTPCQVAGLYAFLNRDYENLITCDIICHGVPSPLVYRKYLSSKAQEYKSPIAQVNFKDKKKGWRTPYITIKFSDGNSYSKFLWGDSYGKLYHSQIITMRACHECKYTKMQRQSDITIGDFWGMTEKHFNDQDNYGTSSVFINTSKGLEIFNTVKKNFNITETTIEEAMQPQLQHPPQKPDEFSRNLFFKLISRYQYNSAIKKFEGKKRLSMISSNLAEVLYKIKNIMKGRFLP